MKTQQETWALLVIDDHGLFRSGLKLILEASFPKARIDVADKVAAALMIPDFVPNMILLDVLLDGTSGLAEIPHLKQAWPDCIIVVVSGDDHPSTKDEALRLGAFAFLRKANDPAEMLQVIGSVYDAQTKALGRQKRTIFTTRQQEIFDLLQQGKSNKAIAAKLNLSEFTVRGHVQAILKNLGVTSRSAAVFEYQRLAGRQG